MDRMNQFDTYINYMACQKLMLQRGTQQPADQNAILKRPSMFYLKIVKTDPIKLVLAQFKTKQEFSFSFVAFNLLVLLFFWLFVQ